MKGPSRETLNLKAEVAFKTKDKALLQAKRLTLKGATAPLTEYDYQTIIVDMLDALNAAWDFISEAALWADKNGGRK